MVGCVIVNYRSPWDMLKRCLDSVQDASATVDCRIVLVDNASGDGIVQKVRQEFPAAHTVEMPSNAGFAAAVNRGIREIEEQYLLVLNTDTVLAEDALSLMVQAMERGGPDVAGIAPKMISSSHEGVLDAVGIVIPPDGAAFNRGIGQCDLGQYDDPEEVAGACFGAALLKTGLFHQDRVGPLYEDYFLYFEDSDWCMRAVSQGYRFLTAPDAAVLHMHSGVARHESLDLKYGLIELNTLKMVTRTFESGLRVIPIVSSRIARLLARTFIRRRFIGPNLRTISAYLAALPRLLRERRELKSKRLASDSRVFEMAAGESAYFDTVAYRPDRCVASLIDSNLRLLSKTGNPETGKLLAVLYRLSARAANTAADRIGESGHPQTVFDDEATDLLARQPRCVLNLLEIAGIKVDG